MQLSITPQNKTGYKDITPRRVVSSFVLDKMVAGTNISTTVYSIKR
jgi:hypothetical protein